MIPQNQQTNSSKQLSKYQTKGMQNAMDRTTMSIRAFQVKLLEAIRVAGYITIVALDWKIGVY